MATTTTANDGLPAHLDTAPFLVVASLHGARMQITAGSVLAAAAAAEYWRGLGAAAVDWFLREDLVHPRPVLLFTRRAGGGVVHATELVAGKPVSLHAATCCDTLRGEVMQVCTPDLAQPCPACLTAIRSAGLFSALGPQRRINRPHSSIPTRRQRSGQCRRSTGWMVAPTWSLSAWPTYRLSDDYCGRVPAARFHRGRPRIH